MSPRTTEEVGPRIVAGFIRSLSVVRKFALHPLTIMKGKD